MGRIVVGVDGGSSARVALEWAIKQAKLTDATLDVVVSWSQPMIAASEPIIVPTPDTDALVASAHTTAEHMIAETGLAESGLEYRICTPEGRAGEELVAIAKDADLLVVGSTGASALKELILGSVSNYAAHHATCPIVLVRAPTKQSGSSDSVKP
jgi:nucleotide-binding universal stress UspA family protein